MVSDLWDVLKEPNYHLLLFKTLLLKQGIVFTVMVLYDQLT